MPKYVMFVSDCIQTGPAKSRVGSNRPTSATWECAAAAAVIAVVGSGAAFLRRLLHHHHHLRSLSPFSPPFPTKAHPPLPAPPPLPALSPSTHLRILRASCLPPVPRNPIPSQLFVSSEREKLSEADEAAEYGEFVSMEFDEDGDGEVSDGAGVAAAPPLSSREEMRERVERLKSHVREFGERH